MTSPLVDGVGGIPRWGDRAGFPQQVSEADCWSRAMGGHATFSLRSPVQSSSLISLRATILLQALKITSFRRATLILTQLPSHSLGANTVPPSLHRPQPGSHGHRHWQQPRELHCHVRTGAGTKAVPGPFLRCGSRHLSRH